MTDLQPGDTVRMQSAGETLLVGRRLGEGGTGAVYLAEMNGQQFALKWYRPSRNPSLSERRAANLAKLVERGKPQHSAFVWPIDTATSEGREGFGYVMPLMDTRFTSIVQILKADDPPGFRTLIQIGINLVDAFAALHTNGLCYRDISFGNVYVDRDSGDVAVIDNDEVGPSGGESMVRGTPQFMAPEVIREEMVPRTETDLYSLAIFLFYLFCFGHPLEGAAVDASYSWEDGRRLSEQQLLIKHFGREPVFIFDPENDSNRPLPGDPPGNWWGIYPRFFRILFTRSFTTGLIDPTLTGRLTEGVWRKGLYRLADCISQCDNCQAAIFFDPDDAWHSCWGCGNTPSPPLLLTVPGHAIVMAAGAALTGRHLKRHAQADQVFAEAEVDTRYPGAVMLRNRSDEVWTVEPVGEDAKSVKPRQRLLVRPMTFALAGKRAVIQRAPGGEAGQ